MTTSIIQLHLGTVLLQLRNDDAREFNGDKEYNQGLAVPRTAGRLDPRATPGRRLRVHSASTRIGGGFVTIDFVRRIYSCGYGKPRQHAGDNTYKDKGWQDRILRDAIEHLEAIMTASN